MGIQTGGMQSWLHASWSSEGMGSVGVGGFWCTALHVSCCHTEDSGWGPAPEVVGKDHTMRCHCPNPTNPAAADGATGSAAEMWLCHWSTSAARLSFGDGCACPRVSHMLLSPSGCASCFLTLLTVPAASTMERRGKCSISFPLSSARGFLPVGANLALQCHQSTFRVGCGVPSPTSCSCLALCFSVTAPCSRLMRSPAQPQPGACSNVGWGLGTPQTWDGAPASTALQGESHCF